MEQSVGVQARLTHFGRATQIVLDHGARIKLYAPASQLHLNPSPLKALIKTIQCRRKPSLRPYRVVEDSKWYFTGKYHLAEQKR